MADPIQEILEPLQLPQSTKADTWDAVYNASSPADLETRLKKLPLTNQQRADLWDAKYKGGPSLSMNPSGPRSVTGGQSELPIDWNGVAHTATKALPAIGAAAMVAAGPEGWLPAIGLAALGGRGGGGPHHATQ